LLYVYLAQLGSRVALPRAVEVESDSGEETDLVSFIDERREVVATFRRADVAVYSERDLGLVLPHAD